jgi:hypothetical protein
VSNYIGLPKVYEQMIRAGAPIDIISDRYWSILNSVFPDAKLAILLRNPADNILSISRYANQSLEKAASSYFFTVYILSQANISNIKVINFNDLVSENISVIDDLFEFWNISREHGVSEIFKINHARTPGIIENVHMTSSNDKTVDYTDQWDCLNRPDIVPYLSACYSCCDKLGAVFEMPYYVHQYGNFALSQKNPHSHRLSPLVYDEIQEENGRLYFENSSLCRQLQRFRSQIDELKQWIVQLQSGKDWLESKYIEHIEVIDTLRR